MNLLTVFQSFPDQQSCIDHLENIRWPMHAFAPTVAVRERGGRMKASALGAGIATNAPIASMC